MYETCELGGLEKTFHVCPLHVLLPYSAARVRAAYDRL